MANPKFSLGNLTSDPNFDFIQCLLNSEENNDNSFDFINDDQSPYSSAVFNCSYVSEDALTLPCTPKTLTIMSLNIQSLTAKFTEFKDFIAQLAINNSLPDIKNCGIFLM